MPARPAPTGVELLLRCVRGLEWVVAEELERAMPTATIRLAPRDVLASLPALDTSALGLRTADDAYLVVGDAGAAGTGRQSLAGLAGSVRGLPWDAALAALASVRDVPARPRFDVVASLQGARRSYNRYDVENAMGPALEPVIGGAHLPRSPQGGLVGGPAQLTVRALVGADGVQVALRLGAVPLHRRAYKQDTGAGTLHPPLAAALCRVADPADGSTVADPFCGDGTIPVELLLARPAVGVLAADLDPERLEHARRNAARAGVDVQFRRADAARPDPAGSRVDAVVTNPPWNVGVAALGSLSRSLDPFWRHLAGLLPQRGRAVLLTDVGLDAPSRLRAAGLRIGFSTQVRTAGRVSHLLLCGPAQPPPALDGALARWHRRALEGGVVTATGF